MPSTTNKLMRVVKKHPIGTAAVGGGVIAGAILVGKAAKAATRVVTIKVAARAATDVAKAVRGPTKRKAKSISRSGAAKARSRTRGS